MVGNNDRGALLQGIQTLYGLGTLGGLPDGELLGLFADRRNESAELAFATLMERHGAMALRVCRSLLRDEHDPQDAFQANFLILVRRAGVYQAVDRHPLREQAHRHNGTLGMIQLAAQKI